MALLRNGRKLMLSSLLCGRLSTFQLRRGHRQFCAPRAALAAESAHLLPW